MKKHCSDNYKTEEIFKGIRKHFLIVNVLYKKSSEDEIKNKIYDIFYNEDIILRNVKLVRSSDDERCLNILVTLEDLNDAERLFSKKIKLDLSSLKNSSQKLNPRCTPCKALTKFFEKSLENLEYFHNRSRNKKCKTELPDENKEKSPSIRKEPSLEKEKYMTNINQDVEMELEDKKKDEQKLAETSSKTNMDKLKEEEIWSIQTAEEIRLTLIAEDDEEQNMLRTCYILNAPFEYKSNKNKVIDDLKKKNIAYPEKIEIEKFSDPSSNCFYLKIMFPDDTMAELLLERGLEFDNYPGLVLPCLKENNLEDLLVFHQAFVKSINNEFSSESFDIKQEFDCLFKFFSTFGRIVDFNLEYFPNLIAITYVSCEAVKELVNKDEITYHTNEKQKTSLVANYHQPAIPVRNLKPRNESLYDYYSNQADPAKEEIIKGKELEPVTSRDINYSDKCVFLEAIKSQEYKSNFNKRALSVVPHIKSDIRYPTYSSRNNYQDKNRTTYNSKSHYTKSSNKNYDNVGKRYIKK